MLRRRLRRILGAGRGMTVRLRALGFTALGLSLFGGAATASSGLVAAAQEESANLPSPGPYTGFVDPAKGVIQGRVAMAVLPLRDQTGTAEPYLPWGFKVHLTPLNDPAADTQFGCGSWFQPEAGSYRLWVEGPGLISPFSSVLSFAEMPFKGRGVVVPERVVAAGRAVLPANTPLLEGVELRLLHLDPRAADGSIRWELSRRAPLTEVGAGLQMPTGSIVAGLWDLRKGEYVRISRPFTIVREQDSVIPFEPEGGATLVVQVQRHSLFGAAGEDDLVLELRIGAQRLAPAVTVPAANVAYGIWYQLPAGRAELSGRSATSELDPIVIHLEKGRIERQTGRLRPTTGDVTERQR